MSSIKQAISITDDMWDEVDMENRLIVEQYLDSLTTVTDVTYGRYMVDVRQLVYWIHQALNDKPLYKFTSRDFERYMQVMRANGTSVSTIRSKKYGMVTFFNFIEDVIKPIDERYSEFVNDFKSVDIMTGIYNDKSYPITYDEYILLIDTLRREGNLLAVAWVMFTFTTGANAMDYRLIESSIVKFPFPENADYVLTNTVNHYAYDGTGEYFGVNFKIRRDVYDAMKAWVDSRGYESDYIFSSSVGGLGNPVAPNWATSLCLNVLSPMLGRSVSPSDFHKGWDAYVNEQKKIDKNKSVNQLKNLIKIELTSEPIRLKGYERELKRIIDNL